jgi:DNA-binding LacI/PurR family transcriptional regulator
MRPPTIKDVAARAGVGIGTVSRVINNSAQVSDDTRQRVLQAIQDLGFRPNTVARQLSQGVNAQNLGVVLSYISHYSFMERLRGVQLAIGQKDPPFELILYNIMSPRRYDDQIRAITRQATLAGLLIIALPVSLQQQKALRDSGIQFVAISDHCNDSYPCVGLDNVGAAELAVEHLVALGHRHIAYVGDMFKTEHYFATSQDRHKGFSHVLKRHELEYRPQWVRLGLHGRDEAYAMTRDLLNLDERPTAVFAMSDVQALGVISAVQDAGLRVPHDVSVIGFDDIELSAYTGLTTIRQHLEDSGRLGMETLLHLLRPDEYSAPHPLPAPKLIVRQTTAPLR